MNQPTNQDNFSPPWFLIVGLFLGGALVLLMTMDRFSPNTNTISDGADTLQLTRANWQKEVVESKVPVLVDFGTSWCGPCRELAPIIDALATRYKGKVKVGKVDVDNDPEIAKKYGVSGIPHVFIFNGGEQPRRDFVGLKTERVLAKAIDSVLAE